MQRRRRGFESDLLARARDRQVRRDLADAPLDRGESDQLAIELVEYFGHVRFANDGLQVDRRRRWRGDALARGLHGGRLGPGMRFQ
jgi:hypothetical protein